MMVTIKISTNVKPLRKLQGRMCRMDRFSEALFRPHWLIDRLPVRVQQGPPACRHYAPKHPRPYAVVPQNNSVAVVA